MSHRFVIFVALTLLCCAWPASAAWRSPQEWQGRRIYQIMTDRFSRTSNADAPPCNVNEFCGGTYQGLINQLDYITSLGFNAIWISPIVQNTPGGYHGYWAQDFFAVAPEFGTAADLKAFVAAAHAVDVWVMVDIVVNHVGPVGSDFSTIVPFNSSAHYHTTCQVTQYDCFTDEVYNCRLADLPDLNQSVPFVQQQLLAAMQYVGGFDFDGIRADTVMYIEPGYWAGLFSALGQPFVVGEVWSGFSCVAAYQQAGAVNGVINYPMYYSLLGAYQQGGSLWAMGDAWRQQLTLTSPDYVLNFVDNQDNDRFLAHSGSIPNYKCALAHAFFLPGVPAVFYGTEQYFSGVVATNENRAPLWPTGFQQTALGTFLQQLNAAYAKFTPAAFQYEERWRDQSMYCLIRGTLLLCTTNTDSTAQTRTIPNLPFAGVGTVCNWFDASDCQEGAATMTITVQAGAGPLLYVPKQ